MYDLIRASTKDIGEIASNTGIKPANIQKVKDHLFHHEHLLDRYVDLGEPPIMARFDSSKVVALSWERLRTGTFSEADLQLLRHEAAEANRMRIWGPSYDRAHTAAQTRYPAPILED